MNNADMPAMPCKGSINRTDDEMIPYQFGNNDFVFPGLTKREHFAATVMQGLLASWQADPEGGPSPTSADLRKVVAEDACKYADALLAELENTGGES